MPAVLILLAGCTTTVVGTASPASVEAASHGPFSEVRGFVSLDEAAGSAALPVDVAAYPAGGSVALLAPDVGDSYLVDLESTDDGLSVQQIRPLPQVEPQSRVFVTPDGTAVVATLGFVGDRNGFELLTLERGSSEPRQVPLQPELEEPPDGAVTALAEDGSTLYAALSWPAGYELPDELLAIDVATGSITSRQPVQLDDPSSGLGVLTPSPNGGLYAGTVTFEAQAQLVEYDANLQRVGEAIPLTTDSDQSYAFALGLADDGTVVASVHTGSLLFGEGGSSELVLVRDGAVQATLDLSSFGDRTPYDLAIDAAGSSCYLISIDEQGVPSLATLDLTSGDVVAQVPVCQGAGSFGHLALAADGQTLVVVGQCQAPDEEAFALLIA